MFTSASPTVIRRFCAVAIEDDRNEYSRAFARVKLGDRLSERSRNHRTLIFLAHFFAAGGRKEKYRGKSGRRGGKEGVIIAINQTSYRSLTRANCCAIISARELSIPRYGICGAIRYPATEIFCARYIFIRCLFLEGARYVTCARCKMQVSPKAECCGTWQAQFIGNTAFSRSCALLMTSSPSFPRRMREQQVEA